MIFACMPAYGGDEREVLLWAHSIRRWGGDFARSGLLILEPEPRPLPQDTRHRLLDLGAAILPFSLPETARNFPYAQKVFAAAQAEAHTGDDLLAWMDADSLVLNPPEEFRLPPGKAIACCPVQLKNISAPANEPPTPFWQAIYAGCATPPERIFPVTTTVDGLSIHAHFNAGLLLVCPRTGLLRLWEQNFVRLFQEAQFQPYYAESPLYRIFIHQAILSATLLACLPGDGFHLLSKRYNVPIFLRQRFPLDVPDPVTCRYDEFSFFQSLNWSAGESEADAKICQLLSGVIGSA